VRLLVGPEGGWAAEELETARAAGARVARFGPHVMRIETAAVAACAVVLDQEMRTDAVRRPGACA
jgi:16S rRNA (uracil1498-N3)-methyltransferase